MNRNDYRRLCRQMPTQWLAACAANPSPWMAARHVAVIRIVLRERTR